MAIITMMALASCGGSSYDGGGSKNPQGSASLAGGSSVPYNMSSRFVKIVASDNVAWTATVEADWAYFKTQTQTITGKGTESITLYFGWNEAKEVRATKVTVAFSGANTVELDLAQSASTETPTNPIVKNWRELPEMPTNPNYSYHTAIATLDNNSRVRNYTMCYDLENRMARWVAYPLHTLYTGSTSRSDEWHYDPNIDQNKQVNLQRSYSGSYDRGHQIASADRNGNYNMNYQTFTFSNSTPQMSNFNQQIWANLEANVRKVMCSDTLYVVTGADIDPSATKLYTPSDTFGTPMPKGYFKALLRTEKGNTGGAVSDANAIAIGIYMEHKSYSNQKVTTTYAMSISDLEAKTGITFFKGLSTTVKNSYQPDKWGNLFDK